MIALPAYAAAVRSNARFAEALQVRGLLELAGVAERDFEPRSSGSCASRIYGRASSNLPWTILSRARYDQEWHDRTGAIRQHERR